MAAAPRTQRKLGGLRATRAEESPDAVKSRKLTGRRRSPKLGRGNPLPSAENVIQTHGNHMDASLDHEALASLLRQLRATPSEDAREWHREWEERGGGCRHAAPLQAKGCTTEVRKLCVAAQDAPRHAGKRRHKGNNEVEGQAFTLDKRLLSLLRKCGLGRGKFPLRKQHAGLGRHWLARPPVGNYRGARRRQRDGITGRKRQRVSAHGICDNTGGLRLRQRGSANRRQSARVSVFRGAARPTREGVRSSLTNPRDPTKPSRG